MNVKDFDFELPQELIAQDPLEDRSGSKLLILDKDTGKTEHRIFRDIVSYLNPDVYKRQVSYRAECPSGEDTTKKGDLL